MNTSSSLGVWSVDDWRCELQSTPRWHIDV